jgi:hypothetical protein
MRGTVRTSAAAFLALFALAAPATVPPQRPQDYLTRSEADKVREAQFSDPRIKLFIGFAEDRLKKFQYELARPGNDRGRAGRLNALLDAYIGCMDDTAALLSIGRERQEDIRSGIREVLKKGQEFLEQLEKLSESGPAREAYKDYLEDAILATKEVLEEAEKADKEIAPPPVRRRPS